MDYSQNDPSNWLDALRRVASELDAWNPGSASVTGYVIEDIPAGCRLHAAVDSLQRYYGGCLPKPALVYWRQLLRHARHGGDARENPAEAAADLLGKWVDAEIQRIERMERAIRNFGDVYKAVAYRAGQLDICKATDPDLREKVQDYLFTEHRIHSIKAEQMTPGQLLEILEDDYRGDDCE